MRDDRDCPLKTKRLVIGQITICRGCCCGNVERGLPEVPVEWLKSEWRKRLTRVPTATFQVFEEVFPLPP